MLHKPENQVYEAFAFSNPEIIIQRTSNRLFSKNIIFHVIFPAFSSLIERSHFQDGK
ncbi:hypothetical protein [Dyadobacter frigoris]|uniref:hypothetical protein n=1 Tax=Dyadobacter frigoris TaxID=2576211 RepID=UPI001485BDBA|nr:hypothetical protein [Dyadobacter frigoris]